MKFKSEISHGISKELMTENDGLLYFKVENVRVNDLFDWSNAYVRSDSSPKVIPRRKQRQDSQNKAKTGYVTKINGEEVALFRFGEDVMAVKEKCPHQGGPLHLGDIEVLPDRSLCVRCPWHHWCVELTSGKVRRPEGKQQVTSVYPTQVDENGSILVGFQNFSKSCFLSEEDF